MHAWLRPAVTIVAQGARLTANQGARRLHFSNLVKRLAEQFLQAPAAEAGNAAADGGGANKENPVGLGAWRFGRGARRCFALKRIIIYSGDSLCPASD